MRCGGEGRSEGTDVRLLLAYAYPVGSGRRRLDRPHLRYAPSRAVARGTTAFAQRGVSCRMRRIRRRSLLGGSGSGTRSESSGSAGSSWYSSERVRTGATTNGSGAGPRNTPAFRSAFLRSGLLIAPLPHVAYVRPRHCPDLPSGSLPARNASRCGYDAARIRLVAREADGPRTPGARPNLRGERSARCGARGRARGPPLARSEQPVHWRVRGSRAKTAQAERGADCHGARMHLVLPSAIEADDRGRHRRCAKPQRDPIPAIAGAGASRHRGQLRRRRLRSFSRCAGLGPFR